MYFPIFRFFIRPTLRIKTLSERLLWDSILIFSFASFLYKECCGESDIWLKTCKLLLKFKAVCFWACISLLYYLFRGIETSALKLKMQYINSSFFVYSACFTAHLFWDSHYINFQKYQKQIHSFFQLFLFFLPHHSKHFITPYIWKVTYNFKNSFLFSLFCFTFILSISVDTRDFCG